MEFVLPKQIQSPYNGEPIAPRIRFYEDNKYRTEEAVWICPATCQTIKRGIVSRVEKNPAPEPDLE